MSIKAVHIFLIVCAILLSITFGTWSMEAGTGFYKNLGFLSYAMAAGLVLYLLRVIKKLRSIA